MAKYQPKSLRPKLEGALSWQGKKIRDGFENRIGLVLKVEESKDGIRLRARFPDEKRDRLIYLEPRNDGEFIYPDNVRARYRPVDN